MMYYKMTDENMQTHGGFQWEFDKWYAIDKKLRGKDELCTDAWFHCYNDPLFAAMLNPAHADITEPRLFRCRVKGKRRVDGGDKYGFTMMMIPAGSEMELPVITTTQRIAFGILCAKKINRSSAWHIWAQNWLAGKDRSSTAARYAIRCATHCSTQYAADAAAAAADPFLGNHSATYSAADAAAGAAEWAAVFQNHPLDLKKLAREALKY